MTMLKKSLKSGSRTNWESAAAVCGLVTLALILYLRTSDRGGNSSNEDGNAIRSGKVPSNGSTINDRSAGDSLECKRVGIKPRSRINRDAVDAERVLQKNIITAKNSSEAFLAKCSLLRHYAQHNPEAGVGWLCSLDPSENSGGLLRIFGHSVVQFSGQDWEGLLKMFPPEMRRSFAEGALIEFGKSDAKLAWIKANDILKEYPKSGELLTNVLQQIICKNPEGAREVIDINESPENAQMFFNNALFHDPVAAVRTLSDVSDQEVLEECCIGYIRRIPSDDLEAFGSALISEFQPSADRDRWVVEVVRRIYPDNIKSAAPFIRQISDPQTRLEITRIIYRYADGIGEKSAQRARELIPE